MEDERQAGPERSSGVIQTRSTRRHEAVNISDAARKRRNKSVKRKRDEEEEGGKKGQRGNVSGEQEGKGWRNRLRDTMKRERVDAREHPRHPTTQGAFLFAFPFPHLLVIPLLSLRRTFYFATRHD